MRKGDKAAAQAMLEKISSEVPEKLAKEARRLVAPPALPPKALPPSLSSNSQSIMQGLSSKTVSKHSASQAGPGPTASFSKGMPGGNVQLPTVCSPMPKGSASQTSTSSSLSATAMPPPSPAVTGLLPPPPSVGLATASSCSLSPFGIDPGMATANGILPPPPGMPPLAMPLAAQPGISQALLSPPSVGPILPPPQPNSMRVCPPSPMTSPAGVSLPSVANLLTSESTAKIDGSELSQHAMQPMVRSIPTKAPPPGSGNMVPMFKAPPLATAEDAVPAAAAQKQLSSSDIVSASTVSANTLPSGFTVGGHGGAMFPTKAPPPTTMTPPAPSLTHPSASSGAESTGQTAAEIHKESVGGDATSGVDSSAPGPDGAASCAGIKRAVEDGLLSALAAEAAPWAARKRRRGRASADDIATLGLGARDGCSSATSSSHTVLQAGPLAPGTKHHPMTSRPTVLLSAADSPRASSDTVAAERIVAAAERVAAATSFAAQRSNAGISGPCEGEKSAAERLRRKVIVSNIPVPARAKELADFFTGAIFSATGHTLAAQWQSGEASKVVVGVDILLGIGSAAPPGTSAEVTFGTATGATVGVALNGIQFKGKALDIRRPKGYSGQVSPRTKLTGISIKDLVAGAESSILARQEAVQTETPIPTSCSGTVYLSGIPSSMGRQSVFDLLEQFGGKLNDLRLSVDQKGNGHDGRGMAQYVDVSSAAEAVRFSPLLGFIEVTSDLPTDVAAVGCSTESETVPRRSRRNRFDPEPQRTGTSPGAQPVDLGPFEAVLPPKKDPSSEDLGPFEAVLPPVSVPHTQEDLGPFEAVLPPKTADDDLGPFQAVLTGMQTASARGSTIACGAASDFGPFAAALQDFAIRNG